MSRDINPFPKDWIKTAHLAKQQLKERIEQSAREKKAMEEAAKSKVQSTDKRDDE